MKEFIEAGQMAADIDTSQVVAGNACAVPMSSHGAVCHIAIVGLQIFARVGLHPHEQVAPQLVVVDARLGYTGALFPADPYIDYDAFCMRLAEFLSAKPHTRLLETLAADIAVWSFSEFSTLDTFAISLHKPQIRKNADRLCIEFEWTRRSYREAMGRV